MNHLLLLLSLLQNAPNASQPDGRDKPNLRTGPMRIELVNIEESRSWTRLPNETRTKSELVLRARLVGDRLGEVARIGTLNFLEVVDDKGATLRDPRRFTPKIASSTRRVVIPSERLSESGIPLEAPLLGSTRGAEAFKTLRGDVRVIFARETEGVYFDNPLQFQGQPLQDRRLQQLGIEIRMAKLEDFPQFGSRPSWIGLQVLRGQEYISGFVLCDAWMRPVRAKTGSAETSSGDDVTIVQLQGMISNEHTLVIDVFPKIEDVRVPITLDGQALP